MRAKEFAGTHVHLDDQLTELTFQGSQCSSDCAGHRAGSKWSMEHGGIENPQSNSASFNKGAAVAARFVKNQVNTAPEIK